MPIVSWVRGAALYREGKFAEAERCYLNGIKKNPTHPAVLSAKLDLAYCQFRNKKPQDAEESLRYVVDHAPTNREAVIRLAKLERWLGLPHKAAQTLSNALKVIKPDSDLAALYLLSACESEDKGMHLRNAEAIATSLWITDRESPLLATALSRFEISKGEVRRGKASLARICAAAKAPIEAIILMGETLLKEENALFARHFLRRALTLSPEHPRVLALLAASYLVNGPGYSPEFAKQLALTACQATNWRCPGDMHTLAQAFYKIGDKMSALLIASRAKDTGLELKAPFQEREPLEKLIQSLESGTLA